MSKTTTTAKMRADGTIVEVMSDGSERLFPVTALVVLISVSGHGALLAWATHGLKRRIESPDALLLHAVLGATACRTRRCGTMPSCIRTFC